MSPPLLPSLTISARLALLTASAFAVLIVAVGAITYQAMGAALSADLDRDLAQAANGLQARLLEENDDFDDPDDEDDLEEAVEETSGIAQLVTPQGRVVAASPQAARLPPLLGGPDLRAVAGGRRQLVDVTAAGTALRVMAVPAPGGVATVGAATAALAQAQRALLETYIPIALLATTIAALLGYAIARRGLAPVSRMIAETRAIGSDDLGRRLSLPPRRDELRRLGETLNGMLERLAVAVERERTFTADASHELRTPLAILRAELDLVRRRAGEPEVVRSLESALEEIDDLTALVDDLLVIARADAGALTATEPLDLGDLAAEVSQRFAEVARVRQVTVRVRGAAVVPGDERAVFRALANLVDNALRHTPAGGTVTVEVSPMDGGARITVADTGPGVPPNQLPVLFDRFTHVDSEVERGGAGLGLAIVAAVAAAHGGVARAGNRDGGGLAVTLDLRSPAAGQGQDGRTYRQIAT